MNSSQMLQQNPASFKLFWAFRTLAKDVGGVDFLVVLQGGGLVESLSTVSTHIRFLFRVNSLMSVQVAYMRKPFSTSFTRKFLGFRVRADMNLQIKEEASVI